MAEVKKKVLTKTKPADLRTFSVTIDSATDMSAAEESAALADTAPQLPDLDARQAEIGVKRKTGGPDLSKLPQTRAKPSSVKPTKM